MKNYLWTYVLQLKELAFHLADKDKEECEVTIIKKKKKLKIFYKLIKKIILK